MATFLGFGSGGDGAIALTGAAAPVDSTFTGTGGTNAGSGQTGKTFAANDFAMVMQTQGTGAGNWELIQVLTYTSGTGAFTFKTNLVNTYVSGAQIIKIPQYTTVTMSADFTGKAWNGSVGGIYVAMANTSFSTDHNIFQKSGGGDGFRGGSVATQQGEGTPGNGSGSTAANGNGGGGGSGTQSGGGGGGNAAAGDFSSAGIIGGSASSTSDLLTLTLGGGGGAAGQAGNIAGGNGGGIVFIFTPTFNISTGTIDVSGGNGGVGGSPGSGGGGGAGGCIFIKCITATIGSNKLLATGGLLGNANPATGNGGNASNGIIRIEACTITDSSNDSNPVSVRANGGLTWCNVLGGII